MNMSPYSNAAAAHRDVMTGYYQMQAPIYDFTRWMFLFGRGQIVRDLHLKPGEVVVEVGCGTGRNFPMIRSAIGDAGELIAVDCAAPMLDQARERVRRAGWKNVRVVDHEYGWNTVTRGEANVVLFSYSLSMIPSWHAALNCARGELKAGGRLGVVDFCSASRGRLSGIFVEWMSLNHVEVDRPYPRALDRHFQPHLYRLHRPFAGAWSYFRYVGCRRAAHT